MGRVCLGLTAIILTVGGTLAFPTLGEQVPALSIEITPARVDLAQAQTGPQPLAQGPERLFQALDLTPAQIREMRAIQQRYEPQLNQRRQALRQARQELSRLMAGDAPEAQIRAKFRQMEQLRQQQAAIHFESLLAMRSVLTPTQRRKFADLMQHRQGTDPLERMRHLRDKRLNGQSTRDQGRQLGKTTQLDA